jgi:hypothetical protein
VLAVSRARRVPSEPVVSAAEAEAVVAEAVVAEAEEAADCLPGRFA